MASIALEALRDRPRAMNDSEWIDEEAAWAAVMARDKGADGRFVTGVLTTGI